MVTTRSHRRGAAAANNPSCSGIVTRKRLATSSQQHKKTKKAARVSLENGFRPSNVVPLDTIRNDHILGRRIARNSAARTVEGDFEYCFGKVISITEKGDSSLDGDLYRIAYDDGKWEDLDSLNLFDALLLYGKVVPHVKQDDSPTKNEIKELTDLLFDHSERIRRFLASIMAMKEHEITVRVAHKHGKGYFYFGTVMGCSEKAGKSDTSSWTFQYDDGSTAELTLAEVIRASELYATYEDEDPTPVNTEHFELYEDYAAEKHL